MQRLQQQQYYAQNQRQQQAVYSHPRQPALHEGPTQTASMSPPMTPNSVSSPSLPAQYPSPVSTPIVTSLPLPGGANDDASGLSTPRTHLQPVPSSSSSNKRKGTSSASSVSRNRKERKTNAAVDKTSGPSTSRTPKLNNTPFNFLPTHMKWLVTQLTDPEVCAVLKGERESTNRNPPKARLHERLANEFNGVFGTEITDKQVKNKIESIIRQFNEADNMRGASGFGDTAEATWRNKLLDECPYYFDLVDVWSKTHGELDQEPIDSLQNLNYGLVDTRPRRAPSPDWSDLDDDLDINDMYRPVEAEEEAEEDEEDEEDEEEDEPLTRTHRPPTVSGKGKQPAWTTTLHQTSMSTSKQIQKQKAQGTLSQGQRERAPASAGRQQDQRGRSTTPAVVSSGDATEPPTKAKALSITDALERFTEVSLEQVMLQKEESKHRQELALKQQDNEYNLNLKKIQFEHELKKMELERDLSLKKQQHEKEMMTLHLTALGKAKDGQAIILDAGVPRYLLQRSDPETEPRVFITEVVSSPENTSRTPPGSPSKCPTSPKNTKAQEPPQLQK
ncbi:hypothetical protein BGZ83_003180 [Gryganskiella cystojenkinii]|nr:hypothetical protein BGZ83_003180 [Gryganskiella cystojenkinii]